MVTEFSDQEEWMDYCRRGVIDIFSRYADEENLLKKKATYTTFVCIVDELKNVLNTVMIAFTSK